MKTGVKIGDLFDDIAEYLGVSSYDLEQALMKLANDRTYPGRQPAQNEPMNLNEFYPEDKP